MVVSQYAFLTHIILMGPHDNPKHKKTVIGAVLEHLKSAVFPLISLFASFFGVFVVCVVPLMFLNVIRKTHIFVVTKPPGVYEHLPCFFA